MNKLAASFIICLAFLSNQAYAGGDPEKVKGHGNFLDFTTSIFLNSINFVNKCKKDVLWYLHFYLYSHRRFS
jgi:hypothetical protein